MSATAVALRRSARTLRLPEPVGTPAALREAKAVWAQVREQHGFKRVATPFGSLPGDNLKYGKGKAKIYGLSLAPSRLSGINVCRFSTPECVAGCVAHSGNGLYPAVSRARIAKTRMLFEYPQESAELLFDFLRTAQHSYLAGFEVGVRLNTFSDLDWQIVAPWIFEFWPDLHFYDYTKDWGRISNFKNYSLTYSASERTPDLNIRRAVANGRNVAVVFAIGRTKALPSVWMGLPVVDGDKTDERWNDPKGCVVGLRAKGAMRRNTDRSRMVRVP